MIISSTLLTKLTVARIS